MLIYCDSCILIYYFDHVGTFNTRATNRLANIAAAGDRIATSDLVRLECRVRPLSLGDSAKLSAFDQFFGRPDIARVPITSDVFDDATAIRAKFGFRLGDSLHLAAAMSFSCDRFLTNDSRLAGFTQVAVEQLS